MTTVQYVLGAGLSLLAFVVMVNFVIFLYHRVASSVLPSTKGRESAGAPGATTGDCEARATDVLVDLLAGALGEGVSVRCRGEAGAMHARADVTFRGWIPAFVPDWSFAIEARSVKEDP